MIYPKESIKYQLADKVDWYLNEAPERLGKGEGLRITQPDVPSVKRTVLYASSNGYYIVGPEALIRYAIAHKNHQDVDHLNVEYYGESFVLPKYTDALRKFNEITGSDFIVESMRRENQRAADKAARQLSKAIGVEMVPSAPREKGTRGRKAGALTVVNAKAYISMHKRNPLAPNRLEQVVEFLREAGEDRFLAKHLSI